MRQIECPHCHRVFSVDEQDYAQILNQVRTQEFEQEVAHHKHQLEARVRSEKDLAVIEAINKERLLASEQRSKLEQEIIALTSASEKKDMELQSALELERAKFKQQLSEKDSKFSAKTTELAEQYRQASERFHQDLEYKERLIQDRDKELERLRTQRMSLSTKLIGETLEQHCEQSFNKERMRAFPRAEFYKDNKVVATDDQSGSKGDYVFRESTEDGIEIISIMFEMKNEDSQGKTHQKNEKFFKKLDQDRRAKHCEYAVLVSTLEPENEFYNEGIVNVSYEYPKMYVIRPQFFVPLIALLREAAMNAIDTKRQLATIRQQNVDVTNFENKLNDFKDAFSKNYESAHKRFDKAIDEIDKTIKHLEEVKKNLLASDNQLRLANNKADGLTIRKLTHGNPTLKDKFERLHIPNGGIN